MAANADRSPVASVRPRVARGRWESHAAAVPPAISELRRGVVEFVEAHGADEDARVDIALAVSEALTNAVQHAFVDRERGTVHVVVECSADTVIVRVVDDGCGMTPRPDSPGLGLGLPTMAALTESFDVREGADGRGTEVRLVFATPGVIGASSGDWTSHVLAEVDEVLAADIGWPAPGLRRLVGVLVPGIADACAVELVDEAGVLCRIAAGLSPGAPPGAAAWFTGEPGVGEDDDERLRALGLARWLSVPLGGEREIGSLGIGLRAARPRPDAELMTLLTETARRVSERLTRVHLVEDLERTRRRLERILGALSEAVLVEEAGGRLVYANDAAVRLLGAASAAEVLAADPAELADRFEVTLEDGTPLTDVRRFPGRRLLAGEEAPPLLTRSRHRGTGEERWLLTKSALLDDDGVYAVSVIQDVTELKR